MVRNKIAAILAAAAILSVSAVSADAPYTDLGSLTDRAAVDYLYDTQCLTFITGAFKKRVSFSENNRKSFTRYFKLVMRSIPIPSA